MSERVGQFNRSRTTWLGHPIDAFSIRLRSTIMILIITDDYDLHADRVVAALSRKGVQSQRFDSGSFPQRSEIEVSPGSDIHNFTVKSEGVFLNLEKVTTVWHRRSKSPEPAPHLDAHDKALVRDDAWHLVRSLWQLMPRSFWVNPYWPEQAAVHKPYQLQVASDLGLQIPRTLITNNPHAALQFFNACNGEMIYKSLTSHVRDCVTTGYGIFTTRITQGHIDAYFGQIRLAPCLFQEYVPKQFELRITIIGKTIFATEIDSQTDHRSKDDWRKDLQKTRLAHRPFVLPPDFHDRLLALMDRLGLVFGCVDAIVTPSNRLVFLEINPSGQWAWIEDETGVPLLDFFTDMLIHRQLTPCKAVA
jgi:glutathione synthase/RimK-type ligase-like ATP-grasp enzyme